MADFFKVSTRCVKKGQIDIYPKFIIKTPSKDLMIRGGDFYAVWRDDIGLWSTCEQDVVDMVDHALDQYYEESKASYDNDKIVVKHMWDAESGMIDAWHKYCQKQMRDHFKVLDETIIFSNTDVKKEDYASKKLAYPLVDGACPAYDKLMSTLYSPEERHKIEWAIGSIVTGDSKDIQKFLVLYGSAGTGKSTVLNIIQSLFSEYCSVFDAKALGSSSNVFALEPFKNNPLVSIQHDGDLSRIEDNTRLNSLVSHETMTVNNKFEKLYSTKFKTFLFMGTNNPVRITDAKSGLLRRLIDVKPTGNKVPQKEYKKLVRDINYELGQIAWRCREVYLEDPGYYDDYVPLAMMGASNDLFNFVNEQSFIFKNDDGVTLKAAWESYKIYCDDAKVLFPLPKIKFKEELKSYFREFDDRFTLDDGTRAINYYHGFRYEKFEQQLPKKKSSKIDILHMDFCEKSLLDEALADCHAQYGTAKEAPAQKWSEVKTTLKEIDTGRLHYVRPPQNMIVIDFDIPDENGEKSLERNLEEAAKWPETYAELSKSGKGVHLHYWYDGDVTELANLYSEHIEIKKFTGKAALRRCLSKCCNIDISHISSGLPKKGVKKMVNFDSVKSEKALRSLIIKNLNKEYHPGTKPSIDFIFKILEDAYNSGLKYDVSDMYTVVLDFAMGSTHQSDYCIKLVDKMKWKSEDASEGVNERNEDLIFYDVEVFPNLFIVNYKKYGKDKAVIRMINPKPAEIEDLMKYRLVGFNCRRYDNHILWGRMMGYSNKALFDLSQDIIVNGKGFFGEAYNVSYTDIYDFCAKKQSLKKWEIELGIHHQELGLPWDQPVPEEMWTKVAEYCDNDVLATEAVWDANQGDFIARKILSTLADATVNDTTNQLTTRIIFGKNKKPQSEFNYRFMGNEFEIDIHKTKEVIKNAGFDPKDFDKYTSFDGFGHPIFPGYKFDPDSKDAKSTYRGEVVGEGGYVYAEPNIWYLVGLDDVASMHPSSIEDETLFGPYTENFSKIKSLRVLVKHGEYKEAEQMLGELLTNLYSQDKAEVILKELTPYLTEEYADALSYALKISINSVYGLTSAKFSNPFKDPRNIDNIVAKRGALFMINLKHEVQKRGFTVAHIKTDSIKVPGATPEILDFIFKYGQMYGYTFEHEATYEKMCLVNDAVYIAQYSKPEKCQEMYGYIPGDNKKHFKKHKHPWTATGTQFQVPYVFKKLFSHEPIEFEDLCETKSVTSALYLRPEDDDPNGVPVFVGRVGLFCPIKPGHGGSRLLRESKDKEGNVKYDSATGAKDWFWLEADVVKELGKEKDIDISYYDNLANDAVNAISEFDDFTEFSSGSEVDIPDLKFVNVPKDLDDEVPWGENNK